jgi:hypothetical protein
MRDVTEQEETLVGLLKLAQAGAGSPAAPGGGGTVAR